MSVYAVLPDLIGRYPFIGDTHVHSIASDGREAPEIVAADYRRQGMDFLAMTDHHNYAGSLEMIAAYAGVPLNMALIPGEEVHLPHNAAHIISFGATHSVNAMVQTKRDELEERFPGIGQLPPEKWRGDPDAPCYSEAEYEAQVWALADTLDIPEGVDRFTVGACVWAARQIRAAGGLSVYNNPDGYIGKTLVLSPRNERVSLIESIRAGYCAAVECISPEYRLCAPLRLARYGRFLMENYFPIHDEWCVEEGRLMKAYVCGEAQAAQELARLYGRTDEHLLRKYFAF